MHQTHNVFAALSIGFTISDATNSALRILAELSQRVEVLDDAWTIDTELGLKSERTKGKRAGGAQKTEIELATVHAGLKIVALYLALPYGRASDTRSLSLPVL